MVDYGAMYPDEEDITIAFDRSYSIIQEEPTYHTQFTIEKKVLTEMKEF